MITSGESIIDKNSEIPSIGNYCDVTVNSEVMGDVTAIGGRIIKSDSARVHGNTTEVGIGESLSEIKNVSRYGVQWPHEFTEFYWGIPFRIMRFLLLIGLSVLAIVLFLNNLRFVSESVDKKVGRRALIGFWPYP